MNAVVASASARKSLGEYKPIIKIGNRTEVVEQNPDRFDRHTKRGIIKGNKFARGTTYKNRADAIAAAQRLIDFRREDAEARLAEIIEWATKGNPEKYARGIRYIQQEVVLWGGAA